MVCVNIDHWRPGGHDVIATIMVTMMERIVGGGMKDKDRNRDCYWKVWQLRVIMLTYACMCVCVCVYVRAVGVGPLLECRPYILAEGAIADEPQGAV